ncbi:MAG TPA: molybdopterin-dependent oxidoreductase, partial [Ktedonobacterales bacterium]|nr:molybdopterin-dependent oxidoreductase [Ktedonobacterales bacterium]
MTPPDITPSDSTPTTPSDTTPETTPRETTPPAPQVGKPHVRTPLRSASARAVGGISAGPRDAYQTTLPARLGAALVAAALGLLASLAARYFFGIASPAELFGDRLTVLVPLPVFERLLAVFGSNAKHLYFGGVVVAEGVLTALVGTFYWPLRDRVLLRALAGRPPGAPTESGSPAAPSISSASTASTASSASSAVLPSASASASLPSVSSVVKTSAPPHALDAVALTLLLWLLSAGIFAPLIGGGFFGAGLLGGVGAVFLATLVPNGVFALFDVVLMRRPPPHATGTEQNAARMARRTLLRQGAIAVAVLAGGVALWEVVSSTVGNLVGLSSASGMRINPGNVPSKIVPPPVPQYGPYTPVSGQSPEVTSPQNFYYVSKNLAGDPAVNAATWRLQVGGQVAAPYSLSYDELRALPAVKQYHTLECISNEVGGNLMSNGIFTGVSLADVLNRAGIQRGATEMIFAAADGYSDFLHLSQALDPRSLIVYLLDGQPLPQAHGFPARLLIPGLYGMKNGKWLTSLKVDAGSYTGYWEQQGWTREAHVKLTSRIDVPHDGDLLLARQTPIAGVAYSGANGIAE